METDGSREELASILRRRVRDPRVLAALLATPRDVYVPPEQRPFAFEDRALPFAEGQTISQPTIVAMTTEALEPQPGDLALDVGTGSGYQAAVLARLVRQVFGIERRPGLVRLALANLARDRELRGRVEVVAADAWLGFPGRLRFDVIAVAAAAPEIPARLLEQLAPGGRLVAPVGPPGLQQLIRLWRRRDGSLGREELGACAFVPLVGGH